MRMQQETFAKISRQWVKWEQNPEYLERDTEDKWKHPELRKKIHDEEAKTAAHLSPYKHR